MNCNYKKSGLLMKSGFFYMLFAVLFSYNFKLDSTFDILIAFY